MLLWLSGCKDSGKSRLNLKEIQQKSSTIESSKALKESDSIDFIRDNLEVNDTTVFKMSANEIIQLFQLEKKIDEDNTVYFTQKGITFQFNNDEILFFWIQSENIAVSNPDVAIGMEGNVLEQRYPRAYKGLSEDSLYDVKLQSFEMYDRAENRLRVYMLEGKVHAISYLIAEDF